MSGLDQEERQRHTLAMKTAVRLLDRITVYMSNPIEQSAINLATRHIESAIQGLNPYTGKERRNVDVKV